MMHMWMWFGYDLGEFLFSGLEITSRWAFALTWIVMFFVAVLFEASKVYLARVQRDAHRKLYPFRSDERRNLLCDRDRGMAPTTSRNAGSTQLTFWAFFRVRTAVHIHQTTVFLLHNVIGYLLMLAVMIYNVHLMLAVVFGMMLGYFLFGPKLTRLQMQCFGTNRRHREIICTPECDDTAESTPPLLESPVSSESDLFICRTRTCIQPSHYFPTDSNPPASCYYGAKKCPSRVARARQMQASTSKQHCHHTSENEKEDSPSVEVEDAKLLSTEKPGCCKSEPHTSQEAIVEVHIPSQGCCKKDEKEVTREHTPPVMCCNTKSPATESQEQIVDPS